MSEMQVIMESWNKFEKRDALLANEAYITKVLGIPIPLNESHPYSFHLQNQILQEQMLFEGFWSDVKEMPGQIKDFLKALHTVWSDPNEIEDYYKEVDEAADEDAGPILKFFIIIRDKLGALLDNLSDISRKILSPVIKAAKTVLKWYNEVETRIKNFSGLQKAIGVTALALALQYIWDKMGGLVEDGLGKIADLLPIIAAGPEAGPVDATIKVFVTWFVTEIQEKVIGFIKEKVEGALKSVLGDVISGGVMKVWDALTELYGGAQFIIKTLSPAIKDFNVSNMEPST